MPKRYRCFKEGIINATVFPARDCLRFLFLAISVSIDEKVNIAISVLCMVGVAVISVLSLTLLFSLQFKLIGNPLQIL